jgi:protein gp37
MATSSIEWTDSTWNPVSGCTRASAGCDNCYAVSMTRRLAAMGQEKYQGLVNPGKGHFNGIARCHPEALSVPLGIRRPTVFFVNSMSDLYHPGVPDEFITDVFETMACAPQHTFQVLTKRPERMQDVMTHVYRSLGARGIDRVPLANVWLGTSVEDGRVVERIPELVKVEAAVRFLSLEPLIGPLPDLDLTGIHWVIVGGESGPGSRPMDGAWVEEIRAQCSEQKVPFFFKQWGGPNKKAAGRMLNGRTYNELPLGASLAAFS